jgi:hypothetical protein
VSKSSGNGVLLSSESTSAVSLELNITGSNISGVSVLNASRGGLIYIANTSQPVRISTSSCLFSFLFVILCNWLFV